MKRNKTAALLLSLALTFGLLGGCASTAAPGTAAPETAPTCLSSLTRKGTNTLRRD